MKEKADWEKLFGNSGWLGKLVLVAQSYPTLCDPLDCSPPGSSVHGIFQAMNWSGLLLASPYVHEDIEY